MEAHTGATGGAPTTHTGTQDGTTGRPGHLTTQAGSHGGGDIESKDFESKIKLLNIHLNSSSFIGAVSTFLLLLAPEHVVCPFGELVAE